MVGGKIAQLENRKRLAVEREDYDLAKALKADIEKLRIAGESAALAPPGPATGAAGSKSSKDPEEIFNRVLGKSRSSGAGGFQLSWCCTSGVELCQQCLQQNGARQPPCQAGSAVHALQAKPLCQACHVKARLATACATKAHGVAGVSPVSAWPFSTVRNTI